MGYTKEKAPNAPLEVPGPDRVIPSHLESTSSCSPPTPTTSVWRSPLSPLSPNGRGHGYGSVAPWAAPRLQVEKTLLTESGGGTYQAGKTLSLKCQTSGFQFKTSQLDWYLWTPGHAPLWLTGLNSSSTDATEGRITSSREDNKNQIFLQIEDLGLRDSGQYHCARRVGNGDDTDKLVFGLGTRVIVEPRPQAPLSPSVFLVRDQNAVACLIRNFYPKELHVSLTSSGTLISAQNLTLAPMATGTYSAIHIGRVGENDAITCSVKHLEKEIHMSHQAGMSSPWLTEIVGRGSGEEGCFSYNIWRRA
ncbi:immunoglobulin alpha-2 heavy chain-like [Monodelphis domestica]|uniref:immunoglobulin alpha-2 heavy chain-like n=1 Tax=Monodelphis domestica TaxID=13616 RepID=UPI0024E24BC5|nr:immunoglobulin alpha-2 heavy chain-like [Monodelphis domestica]